MDMHARERTQRQVSNNMYNIDLFQNTLFHAYLACHAFLLVVSGSILNEDLTFPATWYPRPLLVFLFRLRQNYTRNTREMVRGKCGLPYWWSFFVGENLYEGALLNAWCPLKAPPSLLTGCPSVVKLNDTLFLSMLSKEPLPPKIHQMQETFSCTSILRRSRTASMPSFGCSADL